MITVSVQPLMTSVIVHCLSDAIAALAAAKPGEAVTLVSPSWGAKSLGVGCFLAIIAAARSQCPNVACHAVLDCGPFPGLALGALRMGVETVCVEAAPEILDKLRQIAAQLGATVEPSTAQPSL